MEIHSNSPKLYYGFNVHEMFKAKVYCFGKIVKTENKTLLHWVFVYKVLWIIKAM